MTQAGYGLVSETLAWSISRMVSGQMAISRLVFQIEDRVLRTRTRPDESGLGTQRIGSIGLTVNESTVFRATTDLTSGGLGSSAGTGRISGWAVNWGWRSSMTGASIRSRL